MTRERKIYERTFKTKAVELRNERTNFSELASDLGIKASILYKWRKEDQQFDEGTEKLPIKKGLMIFYVLKPFSFVYLKPSIYNPSNNRFSRGITYVFRPFLMSQFFKRTFSVPSI